MYSRMAARMISLSHYQDLICFVLVSLTLFGIMIVNLAYVFSRFNI